MPRSIFNTAFASLDCAVARSKLEEAKKDPSQLRLVLTDCFFDGSTAASEAAAIFALDTTTSENQAIIVADIIKSLPTAIPERTAASLAQVCIFLATNFEAAESREPLNTFCYAESRVKQVAVRATVSALDELVRRKPERLGRFLNSTSNFFATVLGGASDVHDRFVALRGLVSVGVLYPQVAGKQLVDFILGAASEEGEGEHAIVQNEHDYEAFFASELITLAGDSRSISQIVLRCLLRSLEWSSVTNFHSLWLSKNAKIAHCLELIGLDLFLFVITLLAVSTACKGKISECRQAMSIALSVLQNSKTRFPPLDEVAVLSVSTFCVAISAMCAACGASDIAKCAVLVRELIKRKMSIKMPLDNELANERFRKAFKDTAKWKCPKAALCIGLLGTVSSMWKRHRTLKDWLDTDFDDLAQGGAFDDVRDADDSVLGESAFQHSKNISRAYDSGDNPDLEDGWEDELGSLCLTGIALVCLSHPHSQVRYAAGKSFGNLRRSQVLLFFLPSVITHLESETNGVISVLCLQRIVLSPHLLSHQEACKVAMQALLSLVRRDQGPSVSTSYQTGLVAIAEAVKTAPGIATSLLLAEVEKFMNRFELLDSETKTSACAAILKLVSIRPARGTSFIPFISKCITKENMEKAPESAALSFDAMNAMCEEEVLDSVKAVKIVLKSFPDVLSVGTNARLSYLRLLGRVAPMSNGKKGRVIAERVILILRSTLISYFPLSPARRKLGTEERLSWRQLGEAAYSLGQFSGEEVLRISHAREDALEDVEAERERVEGIAKECMEWMHSLVSVTELSRTAGSSATKQLQKLVDDIVKQEWENRQRSTFDPERIAKLRATSERLRRARLRKGAGEANVEQDSASAVFSRAAGSLPVGVIRGVCERCGGGRSGDGDFGNVGGRATAIYAMMRADGLSVALPWIIIAEEVLGNEKSGDEERAAALGIVGNLSDESFETNESRGKWFGISSPLLKGSVKISASEARELFVGMMKYFCDELVNLLQFHRESISPETLVLFVNAAVEWKTVDQSWYSVTEALLDVFYAQGIDYCQQASIEERLTSLLSRYDTAHLEKLLCPALTPYFTARDKQQTRLIARLDNFNLLSQVVFKLLKADGNGEQVKEEGRIIGRALRKRSVEECRSLVYDMCDSGSEAGKKMGGYCLGVGAFLAWDDNSVVAAGGVCWGPERISVGRLVTKLQDCAAPEEEVSGT